jgi:putative flavoprotein involved in K+ transport
MPFPAPADHCPTRDEVVAYLEAYASTLPVEYNSRVERLVPAATGGYRLQLAGREVDAAQVVVATGAFQRPFTPSIASSVAADVQQLHAADYRNPAQLVGESVLVVGGGNTGFQIAEELVASHRVDLAIGSRQQPLPRRVFGRSIFSVLSATGAMDATRDSRFGRRMRGRDTLVGNGPRIARRHGITLRSRAVEVRGRVVHFADGTTTTPDAIIWATGFRPEFGWIDVPVLDDAGRPAHRRGVTESPGLVFVGLPWMHTRGSALLGWVGRDAEYLAEHLEQVAAAPRGGRQPNSHGVAARGAVAQ